jgi:hypothetical protein
MMGNPGEYVVRSDGTFAVLADGSFAVYNSAGECPECCEETPLITCNGCGEVDVPQRLTIVTSGLTVCTGCVLHQFDPAPSLTPNGTFTLTYDSGSPLSCRWYTYEEVSDGVVKVYEDEACSVLSSQWNVAYLRVSLLVMSDGSVELRIRYQSNLLGTQSIACFLATHALDGDCFPLIHANEYTDCGPGNLYFNGSATISA